MKFIENLSEEEFTKFYNKYNTSFMQSYKWGQFNIVSRRQTPYYIGLKENNKLVAATLLLESKTKNGHVYYYAPRGFLIDSNNYDLIKTFTEQLKKFLVEKNGVYIKIDPEIEYHDIDKNGNVISNGNNNYEIYNNLIKLGYKHTGFVKHFENMQPRYTFIIDTTKDLKEIENNINKSVMKKIKKTNEYNMIFRKSNDTKTFHELIKNNSERDGFIPYHEIYYENALKIMDGIYEMFELVINPKNLYEDRLNKYKEIKDVSNTNNNANEKQKRLEKELELLEKYNNQEELVLCSQIIAKTNNKLWTLYIGNSQIGQELHAVNRMYYEIIKYAKESNIKELDLFGTVGDITKKYKNLLGIHKFKENFGGRYVEYIGEFDLVNKPFIHYLLPKYDYIHTKIYRLKRKLKQKK